MRKEYDEVVELVSIISGLSEIKVRDVVDGLSQVMVSTLAEGDSLSIEGFGVFSPHVRKARITIDGDIRKQKLTPTWKPSTYVRTVVSEGSVQAFKNREEMNDLDEFN